MWKPTFAGVVPVVLFEQFEFVQFVLELEFEQFERHAGDGMRQPRDRFALLHRASLRGGGAEMISARGVGGPASGLIRRHDNCRHSRPEPRPRQEQCLQLRVGAGDREARERQ